MYLIDTQVSCRYKSNLTISDLSQNLPGCGTKESYEYKSILWIQKYLMNAKVSQRHLIHQQVAVQKYLMDTKVFQRYQIYHKITKLLYKSISKKKFISMLEYKNILKIPYSLQNLGDEVHLQRTDTKVSIRFIFVANHRARNLRCIYRKKYTVNNIALKCFVYVMVCVRYIYSNPHWDTFACMYVILFYPLDIYEQLSAPAALSVLPRDYIVQLSCVPCWLRWATLLQIKVCHANFNFNKSCKRLSLANEAISRVL